MTASAQKFDKKYHFFDFFWYVCTSIVYNRVYRVWSVVQYNIL